MLTAAVTIVIPTWNGWEMLEQCLTALHRQTRPAAQIMVIDNGSTDGTVEKTRARFPDVQVVALSKNIGFSGACNIGFREAPCQHDVVLLNNDAVADEHWLEALVDALVDAPADVGAVTGKMLSPDGTVDNAGDFVTRSGIPVARGSAKPDDGRFDVAGEVFSVCGGASLYRRPMLADVGALDEDFFAYYEDADLGYRARLRGWRMLYVPDARVVHLSGGTSLRISGFRLYHSTRNLWIFVLKCTPADILPSVLVRAAGVQLFWFARALRRGEARHSLRAHRDAVLSLPITLRKRRVVQGRRVLDGRDLRPLMPPSRFKLG